eukprot:CAMPEP_0117785170 /NCGR_PEP_ID=MMETSP0948-20121206/5108_1 /TAXON_ID=44440 /ORGANISM="Chattonella subsalsa, Strain CCMP2191" /LENGTH=79 /DNA_ID=CAMNT_0005613993 /DNA_START=87 /DNA_END=322 /DNA_ORIENTATION=+
MPYTLFVGNISYSARPDDIADEFKRYGRCFFDLKQNFAFAEFDDERDAEDAKTALDGRLFGDGRISVQWGKKQRGRGGG